VTPKQSEEGAGRREPPQKQNLVNVEQTVKKTSGGKGPADRKPSTGKGIKEGEAFMKKLA